MTTVEQKENNAQNVSATQEGSDSLARSRRNILRLAALGVPAAVTLKASPAMANSVLACRIQVPDPLHSNRRINNDGTLLPAGNNGGWPGVGAYRQGNDFYTGQEVLDRNSPAGVDRNAYNAHMRFVNRLTNRTPGYTCFVSVKGRNPGWTPPQ